jgi:hypothetical protein
VLTSERKLNEGIAIRRDVSASLDMTAWWKSAIGFGRGPHDVQKSLAQAPPTPLIFRIHEFFFRFFRARHEQRP